MDGYDSYIAVYGSTNESDFDLAVHDIIDVARNGPDSADMLQNDGPVWIKGRNRRTGVEGLFPSMNFPPKAK